MRIKQAILVLFTTIGLWLVVASVVFAATWSFSFPIYVTDTSNTSRTYVPILLGFSGNSLVTSGYTVNGLDTNMQEGSSNRQYMMDSAQVLTVLPSLPSGGTVNLNLYTGYSPAQTTFPIIVGNNGYVTTNYTAGLEWNASGAVTIPVYLNGTANNIIFKPGAIATSTNFTGNVTAQIIGQTWSTPAVGTLTQSGLDNYNAAQLVDGNIATKGFDVNTSPLNSYVMVDYGGTPQVIAGWQFYKTGLAGNTQNWDIEYSTNNVTWATAYSGLAVGGADAWFTASWWPVGSFRYWRAKLVGGINDNQSYMELQVLPGAYLTTPYTVGAHTVSTSVIGGTATLTLDAISVTNSLADVATAASNWRWMSNATPYISSISMNVTGVEVLHYHPSTMVQGTTLVDTHGTKNGDITFGTNSNITITYGAMISSSTSISSANVSGNFTSVSVPVPGGWFAAGENLTSLPFYDVIASLSASSGIPAQTFYFIPFFGLVFGLGLWIIIKARSALIAVLAMTIIMFYGSSQSIVPGWIPYSFLIVDLGILYLYRQITY